MTNPSGPDPDSYRDYRDSVSKTAIVPLLVVLSATAFGQPVRLIVQGDDMGFSHSGNEAIIKSYREGIETATEIIVPSPWFPEAVRLLEENPGLDVGIHLALTSEWDNIKWRPIAGASALTSKDGYFHPFIWPNKNYPGQSLQETKWTLQDVEKEFRAQIELAIRKIPRISHISGHMGCTNMTPEVRELATKLAREYNLSTSFGLKRVSYEGPHATPEEKVQSFIRMLETLKPGETYLFIDHPGLDGPELRSIYHLGYLEVAADRQGVTDLFTNSSVKELIKAKDIQLVSHLALRKQ